MEEITIGSKALQATTYILIAIVISLAYKAGKHGVQQSIELRHKSLFRRLAGGVAIVIGISVFAGFTLGNPSCEIEADPIYGGCEQYVDDGYEPTDTNRIAIGFYYLILLGIPYLAGGISKYSEIKKGTVKREYEKQKLYERFENKRINRELERERLDTRK